MAANHGEAYTSKNPSRSSTGPAVGWSMIHWAVRAASMERCGKVDPGTAATARRSRRNSAVRMLVSERHVQRAQPSAPSRGWVTGGSAGGRVGAVVLTPAPRTR